MFRSHPFWLEGGDSLGLLPTWPLSCADKGTICTSDFSALTFCAELSLREIQNSAYFSGLHFTEHSLHRETCLMCRKMKERSVLRKDHKSGSDLLYNL